MATQKMTRRAQIIVRDNKHLSTDDLNARIIASRQTQYIAEDDVNKTKARLATAQKTAARAKEDADALETLVDARN